MRLRCVSGTNDQWPACTDCFCTHAQVCSACVLPGGGGVVVSGGAQGGGVKLWRWNEQTKSLQPQPLQVMRTRE